MPFPLIPIVAALAAGAGITTLVWYYTMPKNKQEEADSLAIRIAKKKFGVDDIDELSVGQKKEVFNEVKDKMS